MLKIILTVNCKLSFTYLISPLCCSKNKNGNRTVKYKAISDCLSKEPWWCTDWLSVSMLLH